MWICMRWKKLIVENPGFDPGASSLLTTHSSDWASPPFLWLFNIKRNNRDGTRTRNRWIRSPARYPIAPRDQFISFPTGFEPAISRFVVSRLIRWATGTYYYMLNTLDGTRTRNPRIRSPMRYPIAPPRQELCFYKQIPIYIFCQIF